MDRLTERRPNGVVRSNVMGDSVMLRLAAYEDTGLMPEQVAEIQAENAAYKGWARGLNPYQVGLIISGSESARAELATMTADRDGWKRRAEAAEIDSEKRKETVLTPIYTCGGHGGYYDDDDEDFWCPMCHTHLGTHRGYTTECPTCGQKINSDSEPCYEYQAMYKSGIEWPVPRDEGKEVSE